MYQSAQVTQGVKTRALRGTRTASRRASLGLALQILIEIVLILRATAEYTEGDGEFEKGNRYSLLIFSLSEDLNDSLEGFANFIGDLGWNEIEINESKVTPNDTIFEAGPMKDAFQYALKNRYSVLTFGGTTKK